MFSFTVHKLDHIVFGALTLEEGTELVESILQAKLSDIGYHKDMGTHNRVIRISEEIYLEVVSIDPQNNNSKNKRWFNLDCNFELSKLNHFLLFKLLILGSIAITSR